MMDKALDFKKILIMGVDMRLHKRLSHRSALRLLELKLEAAPNPLLWKEWYDRRGLESRRVAKQIQLHFVNLRMPLEAMRPPYRCLRPLCPLGHSEREKSPLSKRTLDYLRLWARVQSRLGHLRIDDLVVSARRRCLFYQRLEALPADMPPKYRQLGSSYIRRRGLRMGRVSAPCQMVRLSYRHLQIRRRPNVSADRLN